MEFVHIDFACVRMILNVISSRLMKQSSVRKSCYDFMKSFQTGQRAYVPRHMPVMIS
jgi:hypothetical protein